MRLLVGNNMDLLGVLFDSLPVTSSNSCSVVDAVGVVSHRPDHAVVEDEHAQSDEHEGDQVVGVVTDELAHRRGLDDDEYRDEQVQQEERVEEHDHREDLEKRHIGEQRHVDGDVVRAEHQRVYGHFEGKWIDEGEHALRAHDEGVRLVQFIQCF